MRSRRPCRRGPRRVPSGPSVTTEPRSQLSEPMAPMRPSCPDRTSLVGPSATTRPPRRARSSCRRFAAPRAGSCVTWRTGRRPPVEERRGARRAPSALPDPGRRTARRVRARRGSPRAHVRGPRAAFAARQIGRPTRARSEAPDAPKPWVGSIAARHAELHVAPRVEMRKQERILEEPSRSGGGERERRRRNGRRTARARRARCDRVPVSCRREAQGAAWTSGAAHPNDGRDARWRQERRLEPEAAARHGDVDRERAQSRPRPSRPTAIQHDDRARASTPRTTRTPSHPPRSAAAS